MGPLITFFIIIILSMIIVRISTVLLRMTGLSDESARFQARSAFTGTGFTTRESEMVMDHPVRRKIIMSLMLLRNAGFISLISSLVLSFADISGTLEGLYRLGYLVGGLLAFWLFSRSKIVDKIMSKIIERALKNNKRIHIKDYESLLNLSGDFEVIELTLDDKSWLTGQILGEIQLPAEGILAMGIKKTDGYFIGTPRPDMAFYSGDKIVLYGNERSLRHLGNRVSGVVGDKEHLEAIKIFAQRFSKPAEEHTKTHKKRLRDFFHLKKKD